MHSSNTNEMMRIPEITTEELQTAINKLKKGKSPDSNGTRAEDIKACDDETREMVRQIFNEIIWQNGFPPEAWKKVRIKVIHKKKKMWKMLETTARFVRCQRCTNCSRQYCIADYIHDSTKNKRKIRRDSEALTKLVDQKCHEWGIKMWTATLDFMKAFDSITHKSILERPQILRYRT